MKKFSIPNSWIKEKFLEGTFAKENIVDAKFAQSQILLVLNRICG